ncbi:MAG: RNA polymerase sigma factor [Actinomycetota bacterium]
MNASQPDVRTNEELLVRLRDDPTAVETLYRRCVDITTAFAVKRCDSPEQVHDLVAAIWLEVIDASRRFDPSIGKAVPWILGVATNLVADGRRRRAREHEALKRLAGRRALDEDDVARLDDAIDAAQLAPLVLEDLERLPAEERESIELLLSGLSQAEAAEIAGVAPTAFRMRLSRARKRLRRSVTPPDADVETVPLEVSE